MASGFSVRDALNKNSKVGVDESPRARFRTKDISIFKMYRNDMNFYSVEQIEELAGDILMSGLKQNLELVYAPCEKGEYRIVAGERRWEALKYLVSKGYKEFEIATSKLTTPQDDDEEQVEIIIANAYRTKSITDMMEEEMRLKASLERMRSAGRKVKGYDLQSGRLRDVISSMLHISKTKVAQIEAVNNHLIPEWKEELKRERLTFSAAYELSGMSTDEQRNALGKFIDYGELTHKDIKDMKEAKARELEAEQIEGQMNLQNVQQLKDVVEKSVSESDTKETTNISEVVVMNIPKEVLPKAEEYQEPHPKEVVLIEVEPEDLKQKEIIDPKVSKKEVNDTVTKSVSESDTKDLPLLHLIRKETTEFEMIRSGKKNFDVQKNDKLCKEGDVLQILEFKDGKSTGRFIKEVVTYIVENAIGLEKGYCIISWSNMEKECITKE